MTNLTANDSFYKRLIFIISIVVFLLIFILSILPKQNEIPSWVAILPKLNAILNGTTTLLLIFSLYFIKRKNIAMHKKLNITACVISTIFLLSYVAFHAFGVETKFPADNPQRPLYLTILISHIILAGITIFVPRSDKSGE